MNDDNFELPKKNEEENTPQEVPEATNKPIIEIPQEYYDKLEKEKAAKEAAAAVETKKQEENAIASEKSGQTILGIIISAFVFIALLYLMTKKNHLFIIGFPIYIIILSIAKASQEKNESSAPMMILGGGILAAALSFAGAMVVREELKDFFNYAMLAGAAVGIVGLILSLVATSFIANKSETKALGTLGYLLFFALIFAGPYFAYKKYPETILKYVYNEKNTIVASTEEEYIVKTLKNRYGLDFTCESDGQSYIDEENNILKIRKCNDPSGIDFEVQSIPYSSSNLEYIVKETYVEARFLSKLKANLADELKLLTNANSVTVFIYPKEYCAFVGNCVENEQYIKDYKKEADFNNQFNYSKNLDLKKYMDLSPLEFANALGMGYSINLYGNYSSLVGTKHQETVNSILNALNSSGYKNKNGYIITFKQDDELKQVAYQVEGAASSDGQFKDPVIK